MVSSSGAALRTSALTGDSALRHRTCSLLPPASPSNLSKVLLVSVPYSLRLRDALETDGAFSPATERGRACGWDAIKLTPEVLWKRQTSNSPLA